MKTRNCIHQPLPAGIMDANLEIFADGTKLMAIYNSAIINFEELPGTIKSVFEKLLDSDTLAYKQLFSEFETQEEMLYQYVWCNFGGFNMNPDLEDKNINKEYWDCQLRGKCKNEGIICKKINSEEKNPTPREFQILFLIAEGFSRKEIANKLGTSEFTVSTQVQTLERKLNARSQVDLATFSLKNNLRCFVVASEQPSA